VFARSLWGMVIRDSTQQLNVLVCSCYIDTARHKSLDQFNYETCLRRRSFRRILVTITNRITCLKWPFPAVRDWELLWCPTLEPATQWSVVTCVGSRRISQSFSASCSLPLRVRPDTPSRRSLVTCLRPARALDACTAANDWESSCRAPTGSQPL
jgi:hypothetical protein